MTFSRFQKGAEVVGAEVVGAEVVGAEVTKKGRSGLTGGAEVSKRGRSCRGRSDHKPSDGLNYFGMKMRKKSQNTFYLISF